MILNGNETMRTVEMALQKGEELKNEKDGDGGESNKDIL
jgi:hypothetical protein